MKSRFLFLIACFMVLTVSCEKEDEPESFAINDSTPKVIEDDAENDSTLNDNDQVDDPYRRPTYSIIGNSISTYSGYIPSGYRTYYPQSWFKNVNDTWWMRLSKLLDMDFLANASWSGSTVSGSSSSCFTSDDRIAHLSSNGVPDYIFVAGGTNDYGQNKPMGEESDEDNFNKSTFRGAYSLMLYKLKSMYPNTQVVCLGIFPRKGGYDNKNSKGWTIREADGVIESLAKRYDYDYIDMEDCGLGDDFDKYTSDGLHPNSKGMELIAVHINQNFYKFIK